MRLTQVFLGIALMLLSPGLRAQLNILNAKTPDEIGLKTEAQIAYDNDNPLPYGYVDDRDILWSKTTWEIIDLCALPAWLPAGNGQAPPRELFF